MLTAGGKRRAAGVARDEGRMVEVGGSGDFDGECIVSGEAS